MAISVNIDGVMREVTKPFVCIDGVWRDVTGVKNNIDGVWRESFNTNVYTINVYRYGELYKTYKVLEGDSITLGECETLYDDDTFEGYSKSSASTTRFYLGSSKITPTSDLDLYAVFSYQAESDYSTTVGSDTTQTFTITRTGTATLNATYQTSYQGPSAGSMSGGTSTGPWNSSATAPYYTHNGTIKTANTLSVKEGDILVVTTAATESNADNYYGSGGYIVITVSLASLTLPTYTTNYRVKSHE